MSAIGFLYSSLPTGRVEEVRAIAERIKLRLERSAQEVVAIGVDLINVRDAIGAEQFQEWVFKEFEMSRTTAYRFIAVAERFPNPNVGIEPSALYELAAPSMPEAVIEEVQDRVANHEAISVREIRRLKKEAIAAQSLRNENAELRDEKAELADRLADLSDEVGRATSTPTVITIAPDHDALERQYDAFLAHWRSLQMEIRERFFAEHSTPFAARSVEAKGSDEIPTFLKRRPASGCEGKIQG